MTASTALPCIDLYARPRRDRIRVRHETSVTAVWLAAVIAVALAVEALLIPAQSKRLVEIAGVRAEIATLAKRQTSMTADKAGYARQFEMARSSRAGLAERRSVPNLITSLAGLTEQTQVLEQVRIDRHLGAYTVTITGSADCVGSLEHMIGRMQHVAGLSAVRLTETAADSALGADSLHFRVEAHFAGNADTAASDSR
jgi:Tfp pilus assembly protein PilN